MTTDTPTKHGLLLVNIGTPDAPTPEALKTYLAEFLGDRNVVDYPRWLWAPILHGIILWVRPARSAALYKEIWTEDGSPLLAITQSIARKLSSHLPDAAIAIGMRYGSPSIAQALDDLQKAERYLQNYKSMNKTI